MPVKPKPTPATWLPALLVGQRVTYSHLLESGIYGTITAVGHGYGPGGGQDQALVLFLDKHDRQKEHGWHYLDLLIFPHV